MYSSKVVGSARQDYQRRVYYRNQAYQVQECWIDSSSIAMRHYVPRHWRSYNSHSHQQVDLTQQWMGSGLRRATKTECHNPMQHCNVHIPQTANKENARKTKIKNGDSCVNSCSICLEELKDTLPQLATCAHTRTLPCKHIFHFVCIEKWLKHNDSCPMCRCSVFSNASGHSRCDWIENILS